jgi:hypothetical protein
MEGRRNVKGWALKERGKCQSVEGEGQESPSKEISR